MRSSLVICHRKNSFGRVTGLLLLPLSTLLLTGCDLLGDSADDIRARKAAQAHAEGAACRQVGMSIQECMDEYKGVKASILTGWKEMDQYMRENNMEEAPRLKPPAPPPTESESKSSPAKAPEPEAKPAESAADKATPRSASVGARTPGRAAPGAPTGDSVATAEDVDPPPKPHVQHRVLVSRELDQAGSRFDYRR